MRVMPPERFPGDDESESRSRWIRRDVRYLPYDDSMAAGDVRSLEDGFSANRIAYGSTKAMHGLSRQQQLQPDEHDVRLVPPDRLQQCDQPGRPRGSWLPDHMPAVPRHGAMVGWRV